MALVRVSKKAKNYARKKCQLQSALIRKKWRDEKRVYRKKKMGYTYIPPPDQLGSGIVPPSPEDLKTIADYVQKPQQQLGGSSEKMELGTIVPNHEVIIAPGQYTKFSHPTQIIISGPTKAGKTTLTTQILAHRDLMFANPPLQEIYWFYTMEPSISQPRALLPGVNFIQGHPTMEKLESMDVSVPKLVVLDDMMDMVDKKATFEDLKRLFTAVSHHNNMTVIFIVQDLYVHKNMTRLANQAENILAMCNGAAGYQVAKLSNKLFGPGHEPFIRWAILHTLSHSPYGYLLLSTGAGVPECRRVRSKILPEEDNTFYIKKGSVKTEAYQQLKKNGQEKEGEGSSSSSQDPQHPLHN